MNQTPAQQWIELSALYEAADELPATERAEWLAKLEREAHPLLPQLLRMLEARDRIETDDFLCTLPKLEALPPASTEPLWATGRRVGPYRLVRPLGEGGMAEVWLAERDDGAFTRQVAIKLPFPRPGREGLAARFDRERDILASLRHPHIAGLFDAGVTPQGQAWLALEYVEGEPLSIWCDRRKLPARERVALFRQVLLAVQHAHANLVIHRDLKPGNILVTAHGEARLLDFGIAKLLEAEGEAIDETELTRVAGRSLTPRYASPEQIAGKPLTTACDVYALGVVLYELLCGERPYELRSESVAQLEQAILEIDPRAPSRRVGNAALADERGVTPRQLRRVLSPELDAIVLRCLRKPVGQRYSSVDALLADVDRWLAGEAVLARSPGAGYRFVKFALRHRLGMALGATGLAALVGMTTVATVFGLHAREESARAVASRDFMLGLFRAADREKSRGADMTARELLQTGRRDVLTQLSDQPKLQSDLLAGIASIQFDMGEYASSAGTYEDVARLTGATSEPDRQAMALAGQADAIVRTGDIQRAGDLLSRAKALMRVPSADVQAKIATVEGWVAVISGRTDVARASFREARSWAVRQRGSATSAVSDALRGSIYVEQNSLHYDEALALQRELEDIVRDQPHPKPRELMDLAYRKSDLTFAAGRYAQGWTDAAQFSADCSATLGVNDAICRRLALGVLKARVRMGYGQADRETVRVAETMAEDGEGPVARADALYTLLRLSSLNGPSPRQVELVRTVQARLDASDSSLTTADRVKLGVGLAEAALLVGDPVEAGRLAQRALDLSAAGQPPGRTSPWTAMANLVLAVSERLSGQALASIERLARSRDDMGRMLGVSHPMSRIFELDRAVSLADLGRTDEALAIVEHEKPLIASSFGTQSPLHARLLSLEQELVSRRARISSPPPGSAKLPYIFI